MSLAPQELENTASRYASEAIKFDSQGARGMAITHYQQAIDALVKLLQLYPNSKLNQIYKERCNSYHGIEFKHYNNLMVLSLQLIQKLLIQTKRNLYKDKKMKMILKN